MTQFQSINVRGAKVRIHFVLYINKYDKNYNVPPPNNV